MDGWVVWLLIAGALIIVEMLTFTLVLLWLAAGAAAAAVVAAIAPEQTWLQLLTGAAAALLLTAYAQPIARKLRGSGARGYRAPIDELVGREGVVVEPVERGKPGIVRVGTDEWSALSREPLAAGDRVEIVSRGTTIVQVRKKESAE